jgi:hypothetical protein
MNEAVGEAVLARAVAEARDLWGARLLGAYALGSLAHGGFSNLVSDVDLGLVLADPLEEADAGRVADLGARVRASGLPLAERLSVFWGSPASLRGQTDVGRFPPHDRLDLIRHGRLLAGRDVREGLPVPDTREMVLAAARQALRSLATPEVTAELGDAAGLVAQGARPLTKRILFPVRFVYTARTGALGRNDDAVAHFVASEASPLADLAAAALRWRVEPPPPDDPGAVALVAAGLRPVYQRFVADYEGRLRAFDEPALAERYAAWQAALAGGA